MGVLIEIYRAFLRALQPLARVVLRAGALLSERWRAGWRQRLGDVPAIERTDRKLVWLHAASVGEVETAWPLVKKLLDRFDVVVSTLTPTGQEVVRNRGGVKGSFLLPLDMPGFVARAFDRVRPDLIVVAETEIWPCFICEAARRNIPLAFVNARISDRTLARYALLRRFFAPLLNSAAFIGVQSEEHARRFGKLGIDAGKIVRLGNLKLDIDPQELGRRAEALADELGRFVPPDRPVVVFASTHRGEEKLLVPVISSLAGRAFCVLVPRHPERAEEVARLLRSGGIEFSLLSSNEPHPDVLVVDAIGKLLFFYARATLAFVGGSLVPVGGHNIAEPAAFAKPVLFGPHMFNFRDAARILLDARGAVMVESADELADALGVLLENPSTAREMGNRAREALQVHRGATQRTYQAVLELAGKSSDFEAS